MNEAMRNAIEAMKKALAESDELKAYNAAKEAYEEDNAPIEVDGPIDIGSITKGEG